MDFSKMTFSELLSLYASVVTELRARDLVRPTYDRALNAVRTTISHFAAAEEKLRQQ